MTGNTEDWQGYGVTRTLIHWWWEDKLAQPLQKTIWWHVLKLNICLAYDPEILLLGIYPRNMNAYSQKKIVKRHQQECS